MTWIAWLTAGVAAYGAILSTITLILHIRSKQSRLRVSVERGFLTLSTGRWSDEMFTFDARNHGETNVTLDAPQLRLPDKRTAVLPSQWLGSEVSFPHRLGPGEACKAWVPRRALAEALAEHGYKNTIKLRCFFRDRLGEEHMSAAFKFNASDELKLARRAISQRLK